MGSRLRGSTQLILFRLARNHQFLIEKIEEGTDARCRTVSGRVERVNVLTVSGVLVREHFDEPPRAKSCATWKRPCRATPPPATAIWRTTSPELPKKLP